VASPEAAGYSGTPLPRKLGFKAGMRVHYAGAPDGFDALLGELPDGVRVLARAADGLDLAVLFVRQRRELERRLPGLHGKLDRDGMIWFAWPKRSSGVATDMTEDVVRDVALPRGLVDQAAHPVPRRRVRRVGQQHLAHQPIAVGAIALPRGGDSLFKLL